MFMHFVYGGDNLYILLYLLALRTDDSRLEASSLAIIAAIEKSVAEPAAFLLPAVV